MTEKIERCRAMRIGAIALRKIAARETDPTLAAELVRVAEQMDERAAELEGSFIDQPALWLRP
jgi:hypothetical protein